MKEGTTSGLHKVLSFVSQSPLGYLHFLFEGTFQINTLIPFKMLPKMVIELWNWPWWNCANLWDKHTNQHESENRAENRAWPGKGPALSEGAGRGLWSFRRCLWDVLALHPGPRPLIPQPSSESRQNPDSRQTKINKVLRDTKTRLRIQP